MRVSLALTAALLAGCGGAAPPAPKAPPNAPRADPPKRVHCPPDAPRGCRSVLGRVLYVEAVDPDGDGDAHFVLAGAPGISGPGITSVDVERALRPGRLPRVGDWVTAAGPVYRGGYGQRQIEALVLRIKRVP
jgi:hypothetical protein